MADEASLVVGVVGLALQFFVAAKTGFKILRDAESVNKDTKLLQTFVGVEQIRFEVWAKEVGLDMDSPVEFEERFRSNRVVYIITMDILRQVCDLVTKHKDLERRYGLKALATRRTEVVEDDITDFRIDLMATSQDLWTIKAQENWEKALLESQQGISKMRKLKWSIADKDKFEALVKNLRGLNDGLREILPPTRQRTLDRSLVMNQPSKPEVLDILAKIEAISSTYAAAAMFKSTAIRQLQSMVSKTALSSQEAKKLMIKADAVTSSDTTANRVLGKLQKGNIQLDILIEHRKFQGESPEMRETLKERTLRLIQLLCVSPKPSEYRVLDCQGYIKKGDRDTEQWGLIFSVPTEVTNRTNLSLFTLHNVLRDTRSNSPPSEFSLGDRFRLASLLANSLAYIHAVGWLHRSLTSRCVLCFSAEGKASIKYPYLGGFEYARIDSTQEISDVDPNSVSTLHHHPDYRQSARRNRYRRSFEYYSLGIVLVEIALWKRIEALDNDSFDPHTFARHIRLKVAPLLEFYMGSIYYEATMFCLDTSRFGLGDDDGEKLTEAFSQKVVQQLDSCRA